MYRSSVRPLTAKQSAVLLYPGRVHCQCGTPRQYDCAHHPTTKTRRSKIQTATKAHTHLYERHLSPQPVATQLILDKWNNNDNSIDDLEKEQLVNTIYHNALLLSLPVHVLLPAGSSRFREHSSGFPKRETRCRQDAVFKGKGKVAKQQERQVDTISDKIFLYFATSFDQVRCPCWYTLLDWILSLSRPKPLPLLQLRI